MPLTHQLDGQSERAVRAFVAAVSGQRAVSHAVLFGSRARGDARSDSDADVAVVLPGSPGRRVDEAMAMADVAFEVLLQTGVLVQAVPLWESEWAHPETFSNPAFIEEIRRDGVPL